LAPDAVLHAGKMPALPYGATQWSVGSQLACLKKPGYGDFALEGTGSMGNVIFADCIEIRAICCQEPVS
jgi:hypothetical protein